MTGHRLVYKSVQSLACLEVANPLCDRSLACLEIANSLNLLPSLPPTISSTIPLHPPTH